MLIQFSVKNFKSIGEKKVFSMAVADKKSTQRFSRESGNNFASPLLTTACIFGPNGGGKTSLINAMDFFKDFVVDSARTQKEEEIQGVIPFKLDTILSTQPSEFEATFVVDGTLYQYGFSVDSERVHGEWLFMRSTLKGVKLIPVFQREFNGAEYAWDLKNVKGQKTTWSKNTKPNTLFLSEAMRGNAESESLAKPFAWIQKSLRILESPQRLSSGFTAGNFKQGKWREKILNLLGATDTKITDIEVIEKKVIPSDIPKFVLEEAPKEFLDDLFNGKLLSMDVFSSHLNTLGNTVKFSFEKEESDGIQVLFNIAGPWFDVLENGYTLVVDELHNSLHPHALQFLVNLFYDETINTKNAQLIFTSHETSIMNKGFMHRDQIWFMCRNDAQQSELYSLAEFKNERAISSFQKSYLSGRFGALPKIGVFHGE